MFRNEFLVKNMTSGFLLNFFLGKSCENEINLFKIKTKINKEQKRNDCLCNVIITACIIYQSMAICLEVLSCWNGCQKKLIVSFLHGRLKPFEWLMNFSNG